ncbi:unnamed protein product [Effrenium voratum]|uniref:Uncharacterized protein n=1 Tax=Effrenium voratum TaxID=2562239 RepID=A0AA36MJX2_9DINO|nr:unnamed protein product [Effrenium voratum]CAJ1440515.1 unnamed protein product [Effrenium voratum]
MLAEDVDTRSPEQIEKIKELLEHVQRLQAARPGSPEYVGHDTWSDRERPWLSRDLATGSVTRPMSAKIILDPLVRSELPESQDRGWQSLSERTRLSH